MNYDFVINESGTMIPCYALYNSEVDVDGILKDFGYEYKLIQILDYLYYTSCKKGISRFSLEEMIKFCGYKLNPHEGHSNQIFKSILCRLKEENYIMSDYNLNKIKPKDFIQCKLNFDYSKSCALITDEARDKIYSVKNIKNAQLLAYYCYINAKINDKNKKNFVDNCTNVMPINIEWNLNITKKTRLKYDEILNELDLIRCKIFSTRYVHIDEVTDARTSPIFYTLFMGNEEESLQILNEANKLYEVSRW